MTECEILEHFKEYGFLGSSLNEVICSDSKKAIEKARLFSYHYPEVFSDDVIDILIVNFHKTRGMCSAFFTISWRESQTSAYLKRLVRDRIEGRESAWLRTEPPVMQWKECVRDTQPDIRFEHWRAPFTKTYTYQVENAVQEKKRRIRLELKQTHDLFIQLGIDVPESADLDETRRYLVEIPDDADEIIVQEINTNLERIRRIALAHDSDYEGQITLEVETDPFQYLFMGEYGFASCLSMRGSYSWGAAANAIDIDKVVIWAKEAGGNIVGRRLIALTPQGVVSYRTYANRHGLTLNKFYMDFIKKYAKHCGTVWTNKGRLTALLSNRWYDGGVI